MKLLGNDREIIEKVFEKSLRINQKIYDGLVFQTRWAPSPIGAMKSGNSQD